MAGFTRHVSAVLVAIVVIAAQIMPAWAGCHSQRHAATAVTMVDLAMADVVKTVASHDTNASNHDGMSHLPAAEAELSLTVADQPQPSSHDVCLGNCGCACGLSGAFVLASMVAIDAPRGIALTLEFASLDLPLGDRPDGPRRPPRITA